jgi:hypothetical protein
MNPIQTSTTGVTIAVIGAAEKSIGGWGSAIVPNAISTSIQTKTKILTLAIEG